MSPKKSLEERIKEADIDVIIAGVKNDPKYIFKNPFSNNLFSVLARFGRFEVLRKMLEVQPALINPEFRKPRSLSKANYHPLNESVLLGHELAVDLLLEFGADAYRKGDYDLTPAHFAARYASKSFIKKYKKALWHDEPDAYGLTPDQTLAHREIFDSIEAGDDKKLERLCKKHPNLVDQTRAYLEDLSERSREMPLRFSLVKNNIQAMRILIQYGASVIPPKGGLSYAAKAVGNKNTKAYELLIESGVDLKEDLEPLDTAAAEGSLKWVKKCIKDGSDPAGIHRIIHYKFDGKKHQYIVEGDVTPLIRAASGGHAAIVKYLLEFDIDLNVRDGSGYNALERAEQARSEECIQLIEEKMKKK